MNSNSNHDFMSEEGNWHHIGSEDRRNKERRGDHDRREMIRFEVDKEDRREGKDRRGTATS